MPTPFYHLALAEHLLEHPGLTPAVRRRLERNRPAFLFGNLAPDYVTLAGLPREVGHFFEVPITDPGPAHVRMLEAHPPLAHAADLGDDQAAFVAGYMAHLWLDQDWIVRVFEPVYGPSVQRSTFEHRLLDHNLLRAHLDRQARRQLRDDSGGALQAARPNHWLPFATDLDLAHWRDLLAEQLTPGGRSQTADVFAHRHGISAQAFLEQLESPEVMEEAVFRHLPADHLAALEARWMDSSIELIDYYLRGELSRAASVNLPVLGEFVRHADPGRS